MERKWWTLVAVCAGTFMLLLDITVVNVALPSIQHSLSASFSDLQWTVDAYALTLAALLLTTGSLADIYGRRLAFVAGLTVFSVSSLLCGLATDSLLLILARALQGVGGAAMFATSLAQEFRLAQENFSFTDEHLREMARNSFEASFLAAEKKLEFLNLFDAAAART